MDKYIVISDHGYDGESTHGVFQSVDEAAEHILEIDEGLLPDSFTVYFVGDEDLIETAEFTREYEKVELPNGRHTTRHSGTYKREDLTI